MIAAGTCANQHPQIFLAQGILVGIGFGRLNVPSARWPWVRHLLGKLSRSDIIPLPWRAAHRFLRWCDIRHCPPASATTFRLRLGQARQFCIALIIQIANLVVIKIRTKAGAIRTLLDVCAFKSAPNSLFTAVLVVVLISLYFPYFYIPVYSERTVGTSADFVFYLLPVISAASFFERVVHTFLANKIGALNVLIPCTSITAGIGSAWVGITTTRGIVEFTVFCGCSSNMMLLLLLNVVASLSLNLWSYRTRMGTSFGIGSFGVLIGNPIAEDNLDISEGSIRGAQYSAGSAMIGGAISFSIA